VRKHTLPFKKSKADDSSSIPTVKNTYTHISPRSVNSAKERRKKSEGNEEDYEEPPLVNFEFPENYSDYDEELDCIIFKNFNHSVEKNKEFYEGIEEENGKGEDDMTGYDRAKIR